MSAASILAMFGCSVGAAACAYADGALLGVDEDDPSLPDGVRAFVERRERLHRALAFGRVVAQLSAGAAAGVALADSRGLLLLPLWGSVLVGVALVVLSETAARDRGDRDGVRALEAMRTLVILVERALTPVVALGEWFESTLHAWLPAREAADEERHGESIERFRQVVTAEAGLGQMSAPLLSGVFALSDTTLEEVMTPRVDIVGIDQRTPWSEVVDRVRSSGHSRLVVYEGDLDGVTGILYAKDLLPFVVASSEPEGGWGTLVRAAAFVPAVKAVDAQLRDFRDHGLHIAIVADEFGGTAGMVTIEDVLELIVGEINDEHDSNDPEVERDGEHRLWVPGRLTLDQLSELTGASLEHDDVSTVGGLAYELFGRVPKAGESIEWRGWRLVMERVRRRRVERVFVERLDDADDEGGT